MRKIAKNALYCNGLPMAFPHISKEKGATRSISELRQSGAVKTISTRGILRVDDKLLNTDFA